MVFLTEVSSLVLNTEVLDMSRGIFVLSLMPLAAVEVSHLLGISRASSKDSKRTSLVPDWSHWSLVKFSILKCLTCLEESLYEV